MADLPAATTPDYRLLSGETAARGVRRVALGRIDSAQGHLRGAAGGDAAKAVHETRKDLKKLRSLLRLVRKPIGRKTYRRENRRFRDAAQLLGDARDAEVRLQTVAALRERYGEEVPADLDLAERLQRDLARESISEAAVEAALIAIGGGTETMSGLDLDREEGFDLLRAGIERSYRRGRSCLEAVERHPSPAAVHAWRKRVKDLWYHLRLLRDTWPAGIEGPEKEAHALADLLGDHHDLTILIEVLSGQEGDVAMRELAERRQGELLADALPLGRRLYAERPRRFADRLGSYWDAWAPPAG